jgi:hypothetical protein
MRLDCGEWVETHLWNGDELRTRASMVRLLVAALIVLAALLLTAAAGARGGTVRHDVRVPHAAPRG